VQAVNGATLHVYALQQGTAGHGTLWVTHCAPHNDGDTTWPAEGPTLAVHVATRSCEPACPQLAAQVPWTWNVQLYVRQIGTKQGDVVGAQPPTQLVAEVLTPAPSPPHWLKAKHRLVKRRTPWHWDVLTPVMAVAVAALQQLCPAAAMAEPEFAA